MNDLEYDPDEKRRYECFDCGTVHWAKKLSACPECGAEMRNRQIPLE